MGAGSRYESDELAGVSHFIEHLPFKGTKDWPTARAVSEAIEGVGGVMNASTDREMTVFWCKVARLHYKTAFAVLLDMVLNSRLDPEEVEKEREVIQEELRMTYDQPSYRVDLLIDEVRVKKLASPRRRYTEFSSKSHPADMFGDVDWLTS